MTSAGEKVIRIVGVGLGLVAIAAGLSWFVLGPVYGPQGQWVAYAPNRGALLVEETRADDGWAPFWLAVIWLSSIAVWVVASLRIWRGPVDAGGGADDDR